MIMEKEKEPFYRLKGLRAELNMTQGDMAKIAGITEDTYRRKENGEREFTLTEILNLSKNLKLDVNYYFFYDRSNQSVTKEHSKTP